MEPDSAAATEHHEIVFPRQNEIRPKRPPGRIIWFTGLSGSGKSSIALALERQLFDAGQPVYLIDGDDFRRGLSAGLGFSIADRTENIRRAAEVARLFADAGFICITAFISPLRADRDRARRVVPAGQFIEVYLATPLEVCRQRDPKGLYARADRGDIKEFTGVSATYESPESPEVVLHPEIDSVGTSVARLLDFLEKKKSTSPASARVTA